MKVLSLISTALLTLSLAGAVQAQPTAPTTRDIAPATILFTACADNSGEKCKIAAPVAKHTSAAVATQQPQTFIMLMLGLVVLGVASRRDRPDQFLKD